MNWKQWIPFALALAFGLLAAIVGRDVLSRQARPSAPSTHLMTVAIALADLPPGAPLSGSNVGQASISAEACPRTVYADVGDLVGRVLIRPAVKGQMILQDMLAPAGSAGGIQALVPVGMRAITLEVNAFSGLDGMLEPGSRVDVVCTVSDPRTHETVCRTVVQNVKVMAVDQCLEGADTQGTQTGKSGVPARRSATLLVMPRQAQTLELASSAGRLRLLQRGPLDTTTGPLDGITLSQLLGTAAGDDNSLTAQMTAPTTQPVPSAAPVADTEAERKPIGGARE